MIWWEDDGGKKQSTVTGHRRPRSSVSPVTYQVGLRAEFQALDIQMRPCFQGLTFSGR